jgi:hypothetical protein
LSHPTEVAIECIDCGAGQRVPTAQQGYSCSACGVSLLFAGCPNCRRPTFIDPVDGPKRPECGYCRQATSFAKWYKNLRRADEVADLSAAAQSEMSDPDRRKVTGVIIAASGIKWLPPGAPCILRFTADHIGVMALVQKAFVKVEGIDYPDVDTLEVGGPGTSAVTTDAGIVGGGFGVHGALQGMAIASVVNSLTRRTRKSIDTSVHLKAGRQELLMSTSIFEPRILGVLLSPTYHRIDKAPRRGELQ